MTDHSPHETGLGQEREAVVSPIGNGSVVKSTPSAPSVAPRGRRGDCVPLHHGRIEHTIPPSRIRGAPG